MRGVTYNNEIISQLEIQGVLYSTIPQLEDLGYPPLSQPLVFPGMCPIISDSLLVTSSTGGESEGLRRLRGTVSDREQWVANFEKPNTSPNDISGPSTTVLSPYLKFGCVSIRLLHREITAIYSRRKGHTQPPVSLLGQMLWREFFYYYSFHTPNFDRMENNSRCRQIPWDNNSQIIERWAEGQTGYPFIDAIMNQLRTEGWIHHLARHAVACFFTRGDLWQHWEAGAKVFERYLLDADWALNTANWQWLSCSNFFHQYFRVYSPVAFGKKTDPDGHYIRRWVPALAALPSKYLYEPWKAPLTVQRSTGCMIGQDYPNRIVIHEDANKVNMEKMKSAFSLAKSSAGDEGPKEKKVSKKRTIEDLFRQSDK